MSGIDGKRMRAARKAKKIKGKDLSVMIGTCLSHISVIEHEKIDTTVSTAKKIAAALDVSMDYLCNINTSTESEIFHLYTSLCDEKKALLLKIARIIAGGGKE